MTSLRFRTRADREAGANHVVAAPRGKGDCVGATLRIVVIAWTLTVAGAAPALAVSSAGQQEPRRDEFGVIPEDAVDKDLTLPDPILDRTWPGPRPGDNAVPPRHIAPDEDETDPFIDDFAPPPPEPEAAPEAEGEAPKAEGEAPMKPARPPVAPDGKRDVGSPVPEADPYPPQILEPEVDEPSEIDDEDNSLSPLERDDAEFDQEADDPGEW